MISLHIIIINNFIDYYQEVQEGSNKLMLEKYLFYNKFS